MEYEIQEVEKAGPPHEALFLVLSYLHVFELLAMSEVCVSLRDAVNRDVFLWLNIVIQRPLNFRLSDEVLSKITCKANTRLTTLVLINCVNITDDGLQQVVDRNPLLRKLYITSCTGLTPEGVIRAVKTLCEHNHNGLKFLRVYGINNMKKEHLETLVSFLQMNTAAQQDEHPILYHDYRNMSTFEHEERERRIDVEICPKCNEVRMVFECPRESCKRKRELRPLTECRGCDYCIPRCEECGGCVESEELEEAVCADTLCSDCWLNLPKCSFCNKPYCKRHANQQCSSLGFIGWVCHICHAKFTTYSYYDYE